MSIKIKETGRGLLIFSLFLLIFGATIDTGILAKIGFAGNFGAAALISFFLMLALLDRHWALVGIAWVLTILSNSPMMAEKFHYNLDIMAAALIAVVVLPYVIKIMEN